MLNFVLNYRLWTTVFISTIFGYFLLAFTPLFTAKPILLIALPVALMFLLLSIIKPMLVLTLVLIVRPLLDNILNKTKVGVGGEGAIGLGFFFNILIVLLAVYLAFATQKIPFKNRQFKFWIFLLLCFMVAVFNSPYLVAAVRLYFNYISYFAVFLIPFLIINSKEDCFYWLKVLCSSFLLTILFANLDLLHGGRFYSDAGMRIMGTFTHPNILAYYLGLAFTVLFIVLKCECFKLSQAPLWLIRVLMANAIVLLVATKSRTGWLAVLLTFFIYGILRDRRIILVLCLSIPLALSVPQVHERFMTVVSDEQANDYKGMNSFEWRLNMWKSCLSMIGEKPFEGHGLATFRPFSEKFSNVGKNGAHNAYLETLFESGFFGLLAYILLLIYPVIFFFRRAYAGLNNKVSNLGILMGAFTAGYMLICLADNLTYYLVYNWYVWFLVSLMMVYVKISESESSQKPLANK